jgi:hypothetical protein
MSRVHGKVHLFTKRSLVPPSSALIAPGLDEASSTALLRAATERFLQEAQGGRAELEGPSWTGRITQACSPARQELRGRITLREAFEDRAGGR